MFGVTQQDMVNAGGIPSIPDDTDLRPDLAPGIGTRFGDIARGYAYDPRSELGLARLTEQSMQERSDLVEKLTGQPLGTHFTFLNDLLPAIQAGRSPDTVSSDAKSAYGGGFFSDGYALPQLQKQLDVEKRVGELQTQYPNAGIKSASDIMGDVRNRAQTLQELADSARSQSIGLDLPFFGRTTALGIPASIVGSINPVTNPSMAAATIALPFLPFGAASAGGRIATAAATNGALSAYMQAKTYNVAKGYGYTSSLKDEATSVLVNTLLGGAMGAAHEYMPRTTMKGAQETTEGLKASSSPLAEDLLKAKTPDDAAAVAASAPLQQKLDLLHEINKNPTSEERGVLQAGERELLIESGQPPGVDWQQHVDKAAAINRAIETGAPLPASTPAVSTPFDQVLNELRADANGKGTKTKEPQSLLEFISKNGGIVDPGEDLQALGAQDWRKPFHRSLIQDAERPGVRTLDDMTNLAHEAGYFPEHGESRPAIADLLDKMDTELRGRKQYAQAAGLPSEVAPLKENIDQFLNERGMDITKMSNEEIYNHMQEAEADAAEAMHHDDMQDYRLSELEDIPFSDEDIGRFYEALPSEITKAGEQTVIPGAEKISDRELAERNMEKPLRSDKEQKPASDGLFDVTGRAQQDMFDTKLPLGPNGEQTTFREIAEGIQGDENLLEAMTTCMSE